MRQKFASHYSATNQQRTRHCSKTKCSQNRERYPVRPPGASKNAPFYVKADCEKGCGYAEDEGWLKRLQDDPNAWFAGAVAFFTLLTLFVLIRTNSHFRISERAYIKLSRYRHSPVA